MTETIGEQITSLCTDLVPTFYSEAETESYPYMVYDQVVTEHRTKDGVYKLTSEVELKVVSNDFDEADDAASAVADCIDSFMNEDPYTARKGMVSKDCVEQIWTIQMNYTITQKSE